MWQYSRRSPSAAKNGGLTLSRVRQAPLKQDDQNWGYVKFESGPMDEQVADKSEP